MCIINFAPSLTFSSDLNPKVLVVGLVGVVVVVVDQPVVVQGSVTTAHLAVVRLLGKSLIKSVKSDTSLRETGTLILLPSVCQD